MNAPEEKNTQPMTAPAPAPKPKPWAHAMAASHGERAKWMLHESRRDPGAPWPKRADAILRGRLRDVASLIADGHAAAADRLFASIPRPPAPAPGKAAKGRGASR